MDQEELARNWTMAQPVVAAYVNAMVPDFHAAEDIVQNVAVILVRKSEEYDETRPFERWAMGVARNEVLANRRSHARARVTFRQEIVDEVASAYADMTPELNDRANAARDCMEHVQGRDRSVLDLWYEGELKPAQIASQLEMPGGTVRAILTRIRKGLRACVEQKIRLGSSAG